MSNRARKRGPHISGAGRGDRNAINGGKSPNTRIPSYGTGHEVAYRNRHFVHAITSLVGCVVELVKTNGEIYEGVFSTLSPQGEVVLEMAYIKDRPQLKPTYIPTLCVTWNEIVSMSSLSTASDDKDIFKTDAEIGTRQNGVSETRELQRFEFDDSSKMDSKNDERLQGLDKKTGWTPSDMFDTNKEKFGVKSSFDPEMADYTTSLELQNNEADRQRILIADKKAREIEEESQQSTSLIDDVGTEEERFSAVQQIGRPTLQSIDCNQQKEVKELGNTTESKAVVETATTVEVCMNTEGCDPCEGDVPLENTDLVQIPVSKSDTAQETEARSEETESHTNEFHTTESHTTTETQDGNIEAHVEVQETESHTEEADSHAKLGSTEEESKKNEFKLNPDAIEFKPSSTTPVPSETSSNNSPPNSQQNFSYNNSRGPRQKGPRGPRPPTFTDQPGIFGYQVPLQPAALRPIFNHQAGLTTGQFGHLTSPTNMLVRQPLAAGSPMIGQQGAGHLYSPMAAQSPAVMGMPGQQLYLSTSQPAAMFSHPSMIPPTSGIPQSPQVLFVQGPPPPPIPGQPFGQQPGFMPPPPQLGAGGAAQTTGNGVSGASVYNSIQSTPQL